MTGLVVAGPMIETAPVASCAFALGSVLPDADMVVRLRGKTNFLRAHQTLTHSLPTIAAIALLGWVGWRLAGLPESWAPVALAAGMLVHTLLDMTNTYGVSLFYPVHRKRFSLEWLFFIDLGFLAACLVSCFATVRYLLSGHGAPWAVLGWFSLFVFVYWPVRALCRWGALRRVCPAVRGLVPSASVPWKYYGYVALDDRVELFEFSLLRGEPTCCETVPVYDEQFRDLLEEQEEYRLMRDLSAGYCAVELTDRGEHRTLVCRDVRTRNFGGHYGTLELTFDRKLNLLQKTFLV
jgi:membrane-bound metal-dependent hydrolase YbcI (DUF457 family)